MGGYDVDVDELRIDLAEATDRALELADELAAAVEAGRDSRGAAASYVQAARHVRGLRRELKTAVAG
jgi:hypothetical protein